MERQKVKRFFGWGLAVFVILTFLDAYVFERYFFQVKQYVIGYKHGKDILQFIHLSDIHLKHFPGIRDKKLARSINKISPDLVLISGDAIDQHGNASFLDAFFELIDDNILIVGIPGNHDYKSESTVAEIRRVFEVNNAYLLVNESISFRIRDEEYTITGVDDFVESYDDFKKAVDSIGYVENHFVLVHSPLQQELVINQIDIINQKRSRDQRLNISYIFAGHNHGGQVTFFGKPLILPEKSGGYVNGWYNEVPPFLYVSKGIGTSGIPFRFFARAEFSLFQYSS